MFLWISLRIARIFDALKSLCERSLERWIVILAACGFVLHLVLIFLARNGMSAIIPELAQLDLNYLHAIYTPFSFVLFYEVLQLVLALPQSHSSSVAKQYQIISLIVVRRVFKDIGEFREPLNWLQQQEAARMVLLDMLAALAMFLLLTLFSWLKGRVPRSLGHPNLDEFILIKKAVALLSCGVLIVLAAYNLLKWAMPMMGGVANPLSYDLDEYFFPAFFEYMIFTDVFLLIISILYYDRYEYVFRNAGFVISTVLLRVSFSTPKPGFLVLAIISMVYGLGVLAVFDLYSGIRDRL
ncbi:MAG: hypothetical protein RJP95_02080 [Pirellulales bacterium]